MAREGPELVEARGRLVLREPEPVEVRGRLVLREPASESLEPPEAQAQQVPE
jgi:hypothetical protein